MFIKKKEILYNLSQYAKVYPSKELNALCLADVQGDFDTIYFDSEEELNKAFKFITDSFLHIEDLKDGIVDFDNNTDVNQHASNDLENEEHVLNASGTYEYEDDNRLFHDGLTLQADTYGQVEFAPAMADAVRGVVQDRFDEQVEMNNNLQNQIDQSRLESTEQIAELRDRNDSLERQLRDMQELIYNRLLNHRYDDEELAR